MESELIFDKLVDIIIDLLKKLKKANKNERVDILDEIYDTFEDIVLSLEDER